jgi:RHS repeat-associated protein
LNNTCAQNYKFEGKERDSETNNDDFGARYYSSAFGRWTSPDWSAIPAPVPYANLSNPQTLNLYAMVSDNPEAFADLDGHGSYAWEQPDLLFYNTDQSEDFRCAGGPSSTCGTSPVAAVQSTSTDGQNQTQNQTLSGPYVADLKSPEMAPLLDLNHKPSQSDVIGNGECVTACKKFSGLEGTSTDQWRAGPQVTTGKDIKPGTAIATFDSNGHYPKGDQPKNSGIFLKKGTNGSIWILDQWPARSGTGQKAHPPQPRELLPDSSRGASNNANAYHVIMVAPR